MLSKAAYYMQDHIRRNYALISDIVKPNVLMARGRQPFPQGLHAIAKIFAGRLPAHVYAHRFFMERQSDPSQPSPQLHITEESQGILKVMGGMRYMRDTSSKLDSTVVIMTDYSVKIKGRLLCIHDDDLKARQHAMGPLSNHNSNDNNNNSNSSSIPQQHPFSSSSSSSSSFTAATYKEISGEGISSFLSAAGGGGGGAPPSATSAGLGGGLGKGIGIGSGGFQGMMNASHGRHLGAASMEPPVFPSPDDVEEWGGGEEEGEEDSGRLAAGMMEEGRRGGKRKKKRGGGSGSMVDPRRSYRFFHVALYPRSAPPTLHAINLKKKKKEATKHQPCPPTPLTHGGKQHEEGVDPAPAATTTTAGRWVSDEKKVVKEEEKEEEGGAEEGAFHPVFKEKEGGYTVLYNPVEVSDKTFADLIHKLHVEERVVGAIVLPTRHAWRHVQLWADAFPDAQIISSGPVPIEEADLEEEDMKAVEEDGKKRDEIGGRRTSCSCSSSGGDDDNISNAGTVCSFSTQDRREGEDGGEGEQHPTRPTPADMMSGTITSPPFGVGRPRRRYRRGGCQDMGGGVMGLSFPEVDEEVLEKEGLGVGREKTSATAMESSSSSFSGLGSSSVSFTSSLGNRSDEDALVDQILLNPGEMYLKPFLGLRQEDAHRVVVLRASTTEERKEKNESNHYNKMKIEQEDFSLHSSFACKDEIYLTPSLQLHFIHGDPSADEYVLYDKQTQTLACTELFHGEYSDFDPVNSWMVRVWFKFMKKGNHKRVDLVPRDKWLGIRYGNHDPNKGPIASIHLIRQRIDELTRKLPIKVLLFAHGTPPLVKDPVNTLRHQWGMSGL